MTRVALLLVLLSACGAKEAQEDYVRKSKQTEGRLTLSKISRAAKFTVEDKGALPIGTVGPTPATPCCSSPDKKCAPVATDWEAPVWRELLMEMDVPSYFQYSYSSDGTSFTATAVGDVMCEGKPITFTITGKVDATKKLVVDDSQLDLPKK